MTTHRWMMLVCVVWALALWQVSAALSYDPEHRTPEFLMDMAHSPSYEAQGENPNFADGRNLRLPVAGTVARGFMPFPYGPEEEESKRAGRELENPVPAEAAELARGEHVFKVWCSACHGAGGLGDGTVTKRGVPPPPSLLADNAKKMRDGEMYHIITLGRKNMASHAAQVTRLDRWRAIHHIRTLQGVKR